MNSSYQEIEHFKNLYPMLTRTQKKIWNYLHWFCSNYRVVKPSHKHIAEQVGCHRDTVIQAIKKFTELGWLMTLKKAWRTCTYFISEHILRLDPTKKETFKRVPPEPEKSPNPTVNPTVNPTHINQVNKSIRNVRNDNVQDERKNIKNDIPYEVEKLPVSQKDKHFLSRFSPRVLMLAIEDFVTYQRLYRVKNVAAFITSRCKAYIQKLRGRKEDTVLC